MQLTSTLLTRLLFIIVGALAASYYLPIFSDDPEGVNVFPVMLVFSFLIAFLINRVFSRRDALRQAVDIELSRMRRILHLTEQSKNRAWQRRVSQTVTSYHQRVSKNFLGYSEAQQSFRLITHSIYAHRPTDPHDGQIFGELLDTTRDLAQQRQVIGQAIRGRLSAYGWLFMATIALFQISLLWLARLDSVSSRLATAVGIAATLLAIEFLYQFDRLQPQDVARFQMLYRENMQKSKESKL